MNNRTARRRKGGGKSQVEVRCVEQRIDKITNNFYLISRFPRKDAHIIRCDFQKSFIVHDPCRLADPLPLMLALKFQLRIVARSPLTITVGGGRYFVEPELKVESKVNVKKR